MLKFICLLSSLIFSFRVFASGISLSQNVKLVVFVPETHADKVRLSMGCAGAGVIGNYKHCSFSTKGVGRFQPLDGAKPAIGEIGTLEAVIEERIETVVSLDKLDQVLMAVKQAHPYEEPGIDIYPLYNK